MTSEEVFVCQSLGDDRCCIKGKIQVVEVQDLTKEERNIAEAARQGAIEVRWIRINGKKQVIKVQDLTKEERNIAEGAKQVAIKVLEDALKKKDKVLMKLPEKVVLEGEDRNPFWMKRHAILTEDKVKSLLAELKKVRFKKEITLARTYAFVTPTDETRTVYLCRLFWSAAKDLTTGSQPGTLIHEVSHFLGTKDIKYEPEPLLYFGCQGKMVKDIPSIGHSSVHTKEALLEAFCNADNVAYEFERTLNHRRYYKDGKYSCCGERARYSVCDRSVPDFFQTCRVGENWKTQQVDKVECDELEKKNGKCNLRQHPTSADRMNESLVSVSATGAAKTVKELLDRLEKIEGKMRQQYRLVIEAEKSSREAEDLYNVGMGIAAGFLLAPVTFGISALAVADVTMFAALISKIVFETEATSKRKELHIMFTECQSFLNDVKRVMASLNHTGRFWGDFAVQYVTVLINQMKKQAESKVCDLEKIDGHMRGMRQCAHLLKNLWEIHFEFNYRKEDST